MPILSSFGGMSAIGRGARAGGAFQATISSNQQELNLLTWAQAQGYGGGDAEITIGSGVYIWSGNTANPALTTGAFSGILTIINNGYITGKGGTGGSSPTFSNGGNGTAGGNAIALSQSVSINNTNGIIGGGGGGAGGGAGFVANAGGGGGGGGAYSGGSGGTSGNGSAGASGVLANGGTGGAGYGGLAGGAGGTSSSINGSNGTNRTSENAGGGGGGGGYMGGNGGNGGTTGAYTNGSGAAGGKAIALNGYSVTWLSGTSQVYGSVS